MANAITREAWLSAAVILMTPDLLRAGQLSSLPPTRVSCGFPKGGRGKAGKAIGQCWPSSRSADQYREMNISPELEDPMLVLATLAHEMVHALDDCASGHKGFFKETATRLGLVGKMTATTAGPELAVRLNAIAAELGEYPHGTLDGSTIKKAGTRMLKVSCACGFIARASNKVIEEWQAANTHCPLCESELTFNQSNAE